MSPPPGELAALREATLEQARAALAEAVTPDRGLLQGVRALDEALEAKVWLKSGGYLVIDQTEALRLTPSIS